LVQLTHADVMQPIERARQAGPVHAAVAVGVAVGKQALKDDAPLLAGALAYRFFLAIFPFLVFLAAVGGYVAGWLHIRNPAREVVDAAGTALPPQLATVVQQDLGQVLQANDATRLFVSGFVALMLASAGTYAVLKTVDLAYEVEESRSMAKRWVISVGLTILGSVGLTVALGVFVGLNAIASALAGSAGSSIGADIVITVLRWPAAFVFLLPAALVIYRVAPNLELPWRRALPGALFFSVSWLIATWLFAVFIVASGGYGATFGTLAGVAILLVWFYLTALLLIVGGELNAVVDAVRHPTELRRARETAAANHH
jgi:membrane protein